MSDNSTEFPKPPKAYKNLQFLNSHEARSIRIQCELEEPKARFEEEGVENTIVFFGSARTPDPETENSFTSIAFLWRCTRALKTPY